jgi:hypothetical protein
MTYIQTPPLPQTKIDEPLTEPSSDTPLESQSGNFSSEQGEVEEWILTTPQLLFEVFGQDKIYRIYTDGRVEGFGEVVGVFNRFPMLYSEGLRQGLAHALECSECRTESQRSEQTQDQAQQLQD